jgi:alkylation response protein AidB-like acyl-CoA dehydrogenase
MFWIDMTSEGVVTRPIACANGRNELAEIFFDDVFVPSDHLVGAVDEGWGVAMHLLQFERGNYAWQRQAWGRARLIDALSMTTDHSAFAADRVGDAYLTWLALRASSRETLMQLAAGQELGPRASVDKVLLSSTEQAILDTARHLVWPTVEIGEGDDAIGWRRDWFYTRMASVYGGAVEVQRDILADRVAGLPKSR